MATAPASWPVLFRGRRLPHTVLLTLSIGVHAIGLFIVSTVFPSVVGDLGGAAFYTWATMLYTIMSIMGTACGGLLKARLDLRYGYILGALVHLAGAVGCAVAPHFAMLLAARALQGLGSGLLIALAYSMISELYDEELRPLILSAVSGMWGVAALIGPMVGGMFADIGWWRGAFWAATPVLLLLSMLAWSTLPPMPRQGMGERLPLLRLLLLGTGVLAVGWSGQVASLEWRLVLLAVACLFVGSTFQLDRQIVNRLFPSRPLSLQTQVGTGYWIFFLYGMTTSQITVFMPLAIQVLYGVSLLRAGYFTAILSIAWTVTALLSASLQDRRVHLVVLLGPVVMTCGVAGVAAFAVPGPLGGLSLALFWVGGGIGLCFAHISSWTMAAAQPGEQALTASSIPMIQSLGIAFGAAIAGLVANAAGIAEGISPATVAAAATWVSRVGIVAPACIIILALRLRWLRRGAVSTAG
ncbi:MFS transporter [Candidatus Entotheonella palauensis]|uniref:MFS transporter n=1 Tax=Candidatus Entotheonella palauensis TaxID=93172 RepID=UPI000B7EC8FA|nr:MFS transporter [Candidatus Entotheonella palauensis]